MGFLEKGLVSVVGVDLVSALVALPLWMRAIPRNVVYGYRTPSTLADDAIWFEANACFGRALFLASALSAAGAWVIFDAAALEARDYLYATVGLMLGPVIVATLVTSRRVGRMKREREG